MMKNKHICLIAGGIAALATLLIMLVLNVNSYKIANLVGCEIYATLVTAYALGDKEAEKAFGVSGVIMISLGMLIATLITVFLPFTSIFPILIYAIATLLYVLVFVFSKRIYKKSQPLNKQINDLQSCLDLIQTLLTLDLEEDVLNQMRAWKTSLQGLDLTRQFLLDDLAFSLHSFSQHYQDEDYHIKAELEKIEKIVFQYTNLSKQAKLGSV